MCNFMDRIVIMSNSGFAGTKLEEFVNISESKETFNVLNILMLLLEKISMLMHLIFYLRVIKFLSIKE